MFLIQGVVLTPVGGHPQFQEVLLGLHVNLEHPLRTCSLVEHLVAHGALVVRSFFERIPGDIGTVGALRSCR